MKAGYQVGIRGYKEVLMDFLGSGSYVWLVSRMRQQKKKYFLVYVGGRRIEVALGEFLAVCGEGFALVELETGKHQPISVGRAVSLLDAASTMTPCIMSEAIAILCFSSLVLTRRDKGSIDLRTSAQIERGVEMQMIPAGVTLVQGIAA